MRERREEERRRERRRRGWNISGIMKNHLEMWKLIQRLKETGNYHFLTIVYFNFYSRSWKIEN